MTHEKREQGFVKRFCDQLGRQNSLSKFLDFVASWLAPPAFSPLAWDSVSPSSPEKEVLGRPDNQQANSGLIFMAEGPLTDGYAPKAPTKPRSAADAGTTLSPSRPVGNPSERQHWTAKVAADKKHAANICNQPKYRGMHGRPCKFAGGSDTKCPKGTVSGWFWKYETPVGVIFYVDCCGGNTASSVFCNWVNEQNWCKGMGRAAGKGITAYTCTLAIPDKEMKTVQTAKGGYEVAGVDP